MAGFRLALALVADPVDAVVIDHDQVVIFGEFGALLAGGEGQKILRQDRLGAAIGIGLENLVAVVGAGGALAIHQGIGIAGVETQLRTGQQSGHPQLGVAGQHPQEGIHLGLPALAGLAVEAISEVAGGFITQGIGDHHKQALEPSGTER